MLVLVVVAALWFSDTLRIPTDGPSSRAAVRPTATTTDHDRTAHEGVDQPARSTTAAQPLRLWIGGDSLAGALGPSLGEMTAATGVVQPQYDSRSAAG